MKKFFRLTFFLFAVGSFLWANLSDELGEYSFSDLACGFTREQVLAIPPVIARSILNSMALSVDVSKYGLDSLGVSDELVASQNGDVAVRIYTVAKKVGGGALGPGIMLVHGGAWIAGNLETHDNISRFLCLKTGFPVVSVAYGLAPECPFPCAINQCKDVIAWMKRSSDLLCVDPGKIAIVGDSAGGNIAAGLCLAVKDSEDLSVAKQILINPALDLTCGGSLAYDNSVVDLLRWCVKAYVKSEEDIFHPHVSPLIADDVAGAAPALLVLAEQDPLCSGGTLFGQKLIDAGVDAEVFIQKGVGHLSGDWSAATKRAEPSLEVVVESLLKLG